MAATKTLFTTIRTEGALLPPDLLQRISEGNVEGLRSEDYHLPGEKLNEVINRSWNALQGVWASFRSAQEQLPLSDLGTTLTRERWLLPLFRELDYGRLQTATAVEIDGRSYPISHHWENIPIHLVSYHVKLDERTARVAGAASASPHSLLQVFLNRSDENLWGFLSNGYRLRILRDNASLTRQAYVEFDLEAMMDGEVYSDFVLLWLLCHQSRVEGGRDCWLEKWMKTAEEQGTRALDQLRDGVEKAITALGTGFIEYPANTTLRDKLTSGALDKQEYYRQLLRLVYRLLFLFVAEDRTLNNRSMLLDPDAPQEVCDRYIKFYSTQQLRQIAETFKGTSHPDLFEGLRLVMRLLSGDSNGVGARLGLVPLGSFLFSDAAVADVIDGCISNRHLLDAVRALALVYDEKVKRYRSIDYKNLGPEELGSIYESLLELHPQINVPARSFALATAGGNERKTTGSYYTPTSLINALLDSALDPVLDEAWHKSDPQQAILALKVCDPACGSGHFLIAAANRIAKALASVRTGEEEPAPSVIQEAKRDVIGRCIYGVDINPMAVELCKVNLWMEALEPGKPLSFLDHRIQCGNSLLGTTPRLMAEGIPSDAFTPIEGDDPRFVQSMKRLNRDERRQRELGLRQLSLDEAPPTDHRALTYAMNKLDAISDDTLFEVRQKEAQYKALASDPVYVKARLLADAWCAVFVWEKRQSHNLSLPMTDLLYRRIEHDPLAENLEQVRSYVFELKERYQFFHWHVAFPDVFQVPDKLQDAASEQDGWDGGFDVVVGNPPWDRVKIQEKEWFAQRVPDIAEAPNAAVRKRLIDQLVSRFPEIYADFRADLRQAEGESHFLRSSNRYPLCGRGDVNTYSIFAETVRQIVSSLGRVGIIVPSGIATDDTTKFFFQDLMSKRALISLYDFENRKGLFPAVDSRMKFCLLTMRGEILARREVARQSDSSVPSIAVASSPIGGAGIAYIPSTSAKRSGRYMNEFAFFLQSIDDLANAETRFLLSAEDIAQLNPNTGTTATFRSRRDAEITLAIYRRVPVLTRDEPLINSWNLRFGAMFHMSGDSDLFHTREQLEAQGGQLEDNHFISGGTRYLPLYEAKLLHQFDHRWATYELDGDTRDLTVAEKRDPTCLALPRYWVEWKEIEERLGVWNRGWLLGFRDITNPTNERTAIFGVLPIAAVGHTSPLAFSDTEPYMFTAFVAVTTTFVLDYVARQKVGGTHLTYGYLKQLPFIPPHTYTPLLLNFIVPRVLELTYTAWDLQPFAQDVGYDDAPFVWDEERRFLMRCELDALYFHLYQIARDEVDFILETFPIVKRKDEAAHGEYLTKRIILEMYDQMAALPKISVPAPKDAAASYLVPDVSQWETWLDPEPASPLVAHIG